VGVVCRISERAVDPFLELLGDHVLESVCLGVDVVDVEPEGVCQVELEQAVMADHLECDPLARLSQARALVGLVLEQVEYGELLDHRRGRRRRDTLVASERGDGRTTSGLLELVDPLQVVLDRL